MARSSGHAGSATEPGAPARVAVALGSNLGDRAAHLAHAAARLSAILHSVRVSRFIETAPIGVEPQRAFLNAAAVGVTALPPRALLDRLLAIERERGRERPRSGAPRTLDLDLILYGLVIMTEPGLEVPHPRFRERGFVLEPLHEIGGDLIDPVTNASVEALWRRFERGGAP